MSSHHADNISPPELVGASQQRVSHHPQVDSLDLLYMSRSTILDIHSFGFVARTRLETLRADQINFTYLLLFVAIALGFAETLIFVLLIKYKYTVAILGLVLFFSPPAYTLFNMILAIVISFLAISLSIIYTIRILRLNADVRVAQQVNCLILCWSFVFYANPALQVLQFIYQSDGFAIINIGLPSIIISNITSSFFGVLFYFYLWIQAETYADPRPTSLAVKPVSYYFIRFYFLSLYGILRTIFSIAALVLMENLPLLDIFSLIARDLSSPKNFQFYGVLIINLFELFLTFWTIYLISNASTALSKQEYLQSRMKQIGFRYFHFHTIMCTFSVYLCQILIVTNIQSTFFNIVQRNVGLLFAGTGEGQVGIKLIGLAFITLQAWSNLPATASGFRGWFYDHETDHTLVDGLYKTLTYRVKEPSMSRLWNPHCFVLETAISMFNFSWLVYSYRGEIQKKPRSPDLYGESNYKLVSHIFAPTTEIHCVIYESNDRIVIAFKGTTSFRDWRTDVHVTYEEAKTAFPEAAFLECDIDENDWKKCRIHSGFVFAFLSIKARVYQTVLELTKTQPRRLLFTGHSLGGSLACLTALGMKLECELPPAYENPLVYTFGAPRLGNRHFAAVYNRLLIGTWAVVMNGDIITGLPKIGYYSVGSKALLTKNGQLFIDPSFGELNLAFFSRPSMEHHKKGAYALGLKEWCAKDPNTSLCPNIWTFWENSSGNFIRTVSENVNSSVEVQVLL